MALFGLMVRACMGFFLPVNSDLLQISNNQPSYSLFSKSHNQSFSISIYRNTLYRKNEMEILFKVVCLNSKKQQQRTFYIKKANEKLKVKTLSDFILTEDSANGETLVYPFGWETEKITPSDIKSNCISIIENTINPI